MKFNPIQLNIFKTLLNDKKFKIKKHFYTFADLKRHLLSKNDKRTVRILSSGLRYYPRAKTTDWPRFASFSLSLMLCVKESGSEVFLQNGSGLVWDEIHFVAIFLILVQALMSRFIKTTFLLSEPLFLQNRWFWQPLHTNNLCIIIFRKMLMRHASIKCESVIGGGVLKIEI